MNKAFGYARVSTQEQSLDSQIDALIEAGAEVIFQEKITGTKKERPELKKLMEQLRQGDKVIVYDLSRLGRNLRHLLEIVDEFKEKGVDFIAIKGFNGETVDTSSPGGKLIFSVFASIAQFQRDQISEKTKAGLEAARARGRKGGRKPKSSKDIAHAISLYESGLYSVSEIEKKAKISRATLYRYIGKRKEEGK